MGIVVAENLTRKFGELTAVRNLNLDIAEGEIFALVGPDGAGKTTLLRMVAGLEEMSGGVIEIGGKDVSPLPPAKRGISMVFQSYALFPHLKA